MAELTGPNTYELTVAEYEELKAFQARECRVREALEPFLVTEAFSGAMRLEGKDAISALYKWLEAKNHIHTDAGIVYASAIWDVLSEIRTALSTSGPCPHQQDACRMRELLKACWPTGLNLDKWLTYTRTQRRNSRDVFGNNLSLEVVDGIASALSASGPCPHAAELAEAKAAMLAAVKTKST